MDRNEWLREYGLVPIKRNSPAKHPWKNKWFTAGHSISRYLLISVLVSTVLVTIVAHFTGRMLEDRRSRREQATQLAYKMHEVALEFELNSVVFWHTIAQTVEDYVSIDEKGLEQLQYLEGEISLTSQRFRALYSQYAHRSVSLRYPATITATLLDMFQAHGSILAWHMNWRVPDSADHFTTLGERLSNSSSVEEYHRITQHWLEEFNEVFTQHIQIREKLEGQLFSSYLLEVDWNSVY